MALVSSAVRCREGNTALPPRRSSARTGLIVATLFGVVAEVSGAQCPDGTPPPCSRPAVRPGSVPSTVAVLYFDNLSRDSSDAYLADGLSEETIARLGRVGRLVVASRFSVRRYRNSEASPSAVGRALGVAYLVTGSVQRAGTRLRVRVELLRAASGLRVWGNEFDRTDTDLLAIQDEVAQRIATEIAGTLVPSERDALRSNATHNSAAFAHFLRGEYYLARRSDPGFASAMQQYEAAIRLDPRFAAAHARIGLAYALVLISGLMPDLPADTLLARDFAATERALLVDSSSSDAWMARGFLLGSRSRVVVADVRAAFARAIAADPRNAETRHIFGAALRLMGFFSEADAEFRQALLLEPARPITLQLMSQVAVVERRFVDARRFLDSAIASDAGFFRAYAERAHLRLLTGDLVGARSDAETALRISQGIDNFWGRAVLAQIDVRSGDTVAARSVLTSLWSELVGRRGGQHHWLIAAGYAALGDTAMAVDVLERIAPRKHAWFYTGMPDFDGMREHGAFRRFVAAAGPAP